MCSHHRKSQQKTTRFGQRHLAETAISRNEIVNTRAAGGSHAGKASALKKKTFVLINSPREPLKVIGRRGKKKKREKHRVQPFGDDISLLSSGVRRTGRPRTSLRRRAALDRTKTATDKTEDTRADIPGPVERPVGKTDLSSGRGWVEENSV